MLPLELFGEFVCTMNRNSKSAKIVRQRQCMIAVSRRHEIRQAMVELSCRLLYLLAQEIEGGELLRAIIVGIKIQVVANCVCSPKSVNTTRDQEIVCDDRIKKFLRLIEKLARLFANHGVFKNPGITPA